MQPLGVATKHTARLQIQHKIQAELPAQPQDKKKLFATTHDSGQSAEKAFHTWHTYSAKN